MVATYSAWWRRCVPATTPSFFCLATSYETRTARTPDASTAIAFVTYLPDPTGNAAASAAATFRQQGTEWRHARTLAGIRNPLAGEISFFDRAATFAVAMPRRGDAYCCPTGRKTYHVALP